MCCSNNCWSALGCLTLVLCGWLFFAGCDGDSNGQGADGGDSETDTVDDADTDDACLFPPFTQCEQTEPAPGEHDDIVRFIGQNAVPLDCGAPENKTSNSDFIVERFKGKKLFMLGEVHGSAEIGRASAAIAAFMAENDIIDALAIEIPMDVTEAIKEYIATGSRELLNNYGYEHWPLERFWRTLPEMARDLSGSGIEIDVFGVDFPWRLAWVNSELKTMAAKMKPEASAIVLDGMPPDKEFGEKVDSAFADLVVKYAEKFVVNKTLLCADLDDIECTNLLSLARGYVLGALNSWPEFWDSGPTATADFMREREILLGDNISVRFLSGTRSMFAHMGAAHVAKHVGQVAEALDANDDRLKGSVFSMTASWGPNSEVLFRGNIEKLDPEPELVSDALQNTEWDKYFILVSHPGIDCRDNPLANQLSSITSSSLDVFDSLLWFRKLTPEVEPTRKAQAKDPVHKIVVDRWQRLLLLNKNSPVR